MLFSLCTSISTAECQRGLYHPICIQNVYASIQQSIYNYSRSSCRSTVEKQFVKVNIILLLFNLQKRFPFNVFK